MKTVACRVCSRSRLRRGPSARQKWWAWPTLQFLIIIAICRFSIAGDIELLRLKVSAPKTDCVDVPVHAVIELPERLINSPAEEITVEVGQEGGQQSLPGQVVMTEKKETQLWWIAPRLKAGLTSTWVATLSHKKRIAKNFSWKNEKGEYLDLLFDGRKVTRYMYAYDDSTPQRVFETYKPFHHVFDEQGQDLLTNGPDGVHPYLKDKILYPHHRGLFIGWSRLEFAGSRPALSGAEGYDFWGMGGGLAQVHQKFLEQVAGPVLARSKALIHWNDKNGEPIIAEQRETTVFRQSEPTILLLDFHTELKAVRGEVYLDGDPEHAGFQYRAHDAEASGGKEVKAIYLFHEDGIDPRKDKDLPWAALAYGLNGKRYTVQYMNTAENPKPTIYSAYRDYGRFGAFFQQKINTGETLTLAYRIWVGQGPCFRRGKLVPVKTGMPQRQELGNRYSAFINGLTVEVMK